MAYLTQNQSGQPVLILKEGYTRERGRGAQHANIMAARIVAKAVKSALGPKGMDKMLVHEFGDVTITSDGRTILEKMVIQHPAGRMMWEVAKTLDDEVGDGTTTAVVIAGELLGQAEDLVDKKVHPTVIIDGYQKAADKALGTLEEIAIPVKPEDKDFLKKVAMTAMASKLVAEDREYLADMAASAILYVAWKVEGQFKVDLDDVMVEKKAGESMMDTKFIDGIVLDKFVLHPDMPKRIENAKVALLNLELEVEKTELEAKLHIESPEQMEAFLQQEENMLKDMVEKIAEKDVNVVICQKKIDPVVQHFLARKAISAVRRVKESDMKKLAKATGGKIVTNLDYFTKEDLGYAELVEERKIGDDKMTFIEGCKNPRSVAILIRGGTELIRDEAERSIHDALCVVRDVVQEPKIVAGGGAPELEVARVLRGYADTLVGKEALAVRQYAEALEAVPTTLSENAGLDPIDMISELRARHEKGEVWAGVDVYEGKVDDMKKLEVLEPLAVKKQVIKSATEAASIILKVDDVISEPRLKPEDMRKPPKGAGGGHGGMPPRY